MFPWLQNRYRKGIDQEDDRRRFSPRIATLCAVVGFACFFIFLAIRIEEENCDVGCIHTSQNNELKFLVCKEECDKLEITDATAASMGQVSCGNHDAESCEECPQGHGASWCHGDCEWIPSSCALQIRGIREKCRRDCGNRMPDSRKIEESEELCVTRCGRSRQKWAHLLALAGALMWTAVTPLFARFPGSCRCNCCVSAKGCTGTTIFTTLGWATYIVACVMVFLMFFSFSDSEFVIFYMALASLSFLFMGVARLLYFREQEKLEMGLTTCSGTKDASVIGNQDDKSIPAALVYELQAQVFDLSDKVRGLEKFVMSSLSTRRGTEPSEIELLNHSAFVPPKRICSEPTHL